MMKRYALRLHKGDTERTIIQIPDRIAVLVFQPARSNLFAVVLRLWLSTEFVIEICKWFLCYCSQMLSFVQMCTECMDQREWTIANDENGVWTSIRGGDPPYDMEDIGRNALYTISRLLAHSQNLINISSKTNAIPRHAHIYRRMILQPKNSTFKFKQNNCYLGIFSLACCLILRLAKISTRITRKTKNIVLICCLVIPASRLSR